MTSKQLVTVRGAVACEPSAVSWVLPHEHLFHSIADHLPADSEAIRTPTSSAGLHGHETSDIRPDQLHELRTEPRLYGGRNLRIEREDEVFREVEALCRSAPGGGVIVDVTTAKEGRDLAKLRRLAERVGIQVVASTSVDEDALLKLSPSLSNGEKSGQIAKMMETELMFGVGETLSGGNAGIIYHQIHLQGDSRADSEDVVRNAVALAQKNTGAPAYLSFSYEPSAFPSILSVLQRIQDWMSSLILNGASPELLVLCHADRWCETEEHRQFLVGLASKRVVLSFNLVGVFTASDVVLTNPCLAPVDLYQEPPRDSSIARSVASLILDHDFGDRIVISSGIVQRLQLQRHGGGGYAYALKQFRDRLFQRHGVSSTQWEQISRHNPLRLLLWYTPPMAVEIPKHFLSCSVCREYFEPIVGEYFTKFQFVYCGTKCLRKHSKQGFKPLE